MDAIALMELLKELALNDGAEALDAYLVVDAAEAGLPAMAPAFVLQERASGRQWVIGVKLLERRVV